MLKKRITDLESRLGVTKQLKPWILHIHDYGEPVPESLLTNPWVWIITIVDPGDIELKKERN